MLSEIADIFLWTQTMNAFVMEAFFAPGAHYRSFFVRRFFLRREHFRQLWLVEFFVTVFERAAAWWSRDIDPFVCRQARFIRISIVKCHSTFRLRDSAFTIFVDGDSTGITAFSRGATSRFTVWLRFQVAAIVWRITVCPQMSVWLRIALKIDDYEDVNLKDNLPSKWEEDPSTAWFGDLAKLEMHLDIFRYCLLLKVAG